MSERDQATLLLDRLYRTVAAKVVIGDVRSVSPNISQKLVRIPILPCDVFPDRSVVGGRFQDVDVRKVRVFIVNATHDLGKGGDRVWHPHACNINKSENTKV